MSVVLIHLRLGTDVRVKFRDKVQEHNHLRFSIKHFVIEKQEQAVRICDLQKFYNEIHYGVDRVIPIIVGYYTDI